MTTIVWPTDIEAQSCDFRLQKNDARLISPISRTVQTLQRQGRRWVAQVRFRVPRAKGQRIQAMLDSGDEFRIWDFARPNPLGPNDDRSALAITYFDTPGSPGGITKFTSGGSPAVLTGFSGGSSTISIYGTWAVGSTAPLLGGFLANSTPLLAGDYLEIGGYLYMLTADLATNGLGRAYASLNRGLLAAAEHQSVVTLTRARATMLLSDNDQNQRPVVFHDLYEFNLSFFEKLPA